MANGPANMTKLEEEMGQSQAQIICSIFEGEKELVKIVFYLCTWNLRWPTEMGDEYPVYVDFQGPAWGVGNR